MGTDTLSVVMTEVDDPTETQHGYASDNNRSAAVFNGVRQEGVNRSRYLLNRLGELIGTAIAVSGVSAVSDLITTTSAHGLVANDPVRIKALGGGSIPGGLSAGAVYYWLADTTTTGKLALTAGGSAVDITSAGTGPLYIYKIVDASALLYRVASGVATALGDAVMYLAGAQTVTGAKVFADLTLSGVSWIKTASRSITRTVGGTWIDTSAHTAYRNPAILATSVNVQTMIELPHGQVLTGVTITIDPAVHGSLPTLPSIAVSKVAYADGTITPLGSQADTSADTTAFNVAHEIAVTGLSETIDNTTHSYRVDFVTSDAASVTVCGLKATCTVTGQRAWV
jgi:hypothetical protein